MKVATKQMAFEFGRNLLTKIEALRERPASPLARAREAALRSDPILEEVSRVLLRQVGCPALAKVVSVCWNPRMRTTAGTACWRTRRVTLNPKLIEVSAAEVQTTLRHELAHLVAQERVGRRRISPHGPEWRAACADLGIVGEARCHTLPFKPRRMTRKYAYQCPACLAVIARVRRPKGRIACLKCCRKLNGGKYAERFRFREVEVVRVAA